MVEEDEHKPGLRFDLLPWEILTSIATHLRPRPHASIYPHPQATSMDLSSVTIPSKTAMNDLVSLALTSRSCYLAALPPLYYAPALISNKQVRLLANSLARDIIPRGPPRQNEGLDRDVQAHHRLRQPHHLFLPNDGLMMANDDASDQTEWAPSLRNIFRTSCSRLDSVLLGARPDGAMLSEFFDSEVDSRPRRVTILNFYSSPPFSTYSLLPLAQSTHLHLIQLIPRDPLINFLSGLAPSSSSQAHHHPLRTLRLSQLHSESLLDFPAYITWRRASDAWNALTTSERRARTNAGVPPPARPARVPARRFEAQETLYSLATVAGPRLRDFGCLIIELAELSRLAEPEDAPLLGGGATAIAVDATTDAATGVLQTTNGTIDAAASAESEDGESANEQLRREVADDAERARTASRDAYWIETRAGREALRELFEEARRDAAAKTSTAADIGGNGQEEETAASAETETDAGMPSVEVRIVAPRPGGWSSDECRQDFEAQVQACDLQSRKRPSGVGAEKDDGTCYSDPDVFWLAEHRPWLSYHGASMEEWEGRGDTEGGTGRNARRWWWTGSLPRVNAGAGTR